jgi:hypothetical protein
VEEYGVCELPERCCKRCEQRGRHDQPVLVHWKVVVDAVEKEVQCKSGAVVGKVAVKLLAENVLHCKELLTRLGGTSIGAERIR